MSGFFTALENELRTAAARQPRRRIGGVATAVRGGGLALVAAALLGAVLLPTLILVGGGERQRRQVSTGGNSHAVSELPAVGTVIPKGKGNLPRDAESTVVATGTAPGIGPWQLEVYRDRGLKDPHTGQVYEPAGLSCLRIVLLNPSHLERTTAASGYCGPQLPGFTRGQTALPPRSASAGTKPTKEILVYGRVPERAAVVAITVNGATRIRVKPYGGPKSVASKFFVIPVKPPLPHSRINWLDRTGRKGSRGIGLMPPLTER